MNLPKAIYICPVDYGYSDAIRKPKSCPDFKRGVCNHSHSLCQAAKYVLDTKSYLKSCEDCKNNPTAGQFCALSKWYPKCWKPKNDTKK